MLIRQSQILNKNINLNYCTDQLGLCKIAFPPQVLLHGGHDGQAIVWIHQDMDEAVQCRSKKTCTQTMQHISQVNPNPKDYKIQSYNTLNQAKWFTTVLLNLRSTFKLNSGHCKGYIRHIFNAPPPNEPLLTFFNFLLCLPHCVFEHTLATFGPDKTWKNGYLNRNWGTWAHCCVMWSLQKLQLRRPFLVFMQIYSLPISNLREMRTGNSQPSHMS